ncbi:MAG: NAD-dependent epimerase/dehydratase family protein, partial [Paracoccaceae bacterium]|nr:NAD-dependent epimerase/dehydratase family protein [Paracoccaceae bacterium]
MSPAPRTALITGSAGFIGYHLCQRLLADGFRVTGLDAMTEYYDVRLKERRHTLLGQHPGFRAEIGRLEDEGRLDRLMAERPEIV